jgi:phage repressor protein C with HTH and peptisase S24 domain
MNNSEKQKFAARLNEALDDADVPQKGMGRQSALVRMLGVSHRVAKKWLDGSEFPPTSKMVKIASLLEVRSNWLFSGQGEKFPMPLGEGDGVREVADITRSAGELSQEAFEVASDWMRLPPQQRVAMRKVMKELLKVSAVPESEAI